MKFIAVLLIVAVLAIAACAPQEPQPQKPFVVESTSSPFSPISVKLTTAAFTEPPKLGSETDLIMDVSVHPSYDFPLPNATVNIDLPEGVELISGDTQWNGDLSNEAPITLTARVKFVEGGNWSLSASAKSYFTEDSWYGNAAGICYSVSDDTITKESGECYAKAILPPGIQELRIESDSKALYYTDPFKGTFQGSDEPKLNSSIKITFSFTPDEDIQDADVKFYLPTGVSLLEGKAEWKGDAVKGQKIELPIKVRIGSGENYIPPLHVQVSGYQKDADAITTRSYHYGINTPTPSEPTPK